MVCLTKLSSNMLPLLVARLRPFTGFRGNSCWERALQLHRTGRPTSSHACRLSSPPMYRRWACPGAYGSLQKSAESFLRILGLQFLRCTLVDAPVASLLGSLGLAHPHLSLQQAVISRSFSRLEPSSVQRRMFCMSISCRPRLLSTYVELPPS